MFQISVDRLVKDELEYELKVRGITDTGNVESMRKHFRSILALEKTSSPLQGKFSLDSEKEIEECDRKVVELRDCISSFTGSSNLGKKIETKFAHLMGRIGRIPEISDEVTQSRSRLLLALSELVPEYTIKSKIFADSVVQSVPLDPMFGGSQVISPPISGSHNISANASSPAVNSGNMSNQFVHKSVPIYKWNLKFSGSSDLSFNAFLQRVEELSKSRQVSKQELFLAAHDLFDGDALNYYHLVVKYANDWDSLISLMREQFVPSHMSDRLWKQILNRTQGPDEPIGLYIAAMTKLFDRMPTIVQDSLRLKVLRANILPFYQERLTLQTINTPFDLIELCRKLEETKINIEQYLPPKCGNLTLEPDLDYHSFRKDSKPVIREILADSETNSSHRPDKYSNKPNDSTTTPPLCYKCNQPNHFARHCTSRVLKCFNCKRNGFTRKTCPSCNPSTSGNDRRSQS